MAYLICAPFVGSLLQKIGRKNMILIGYTICTCATIAFGVCYNIPKYATKGPLDEKEEPTYIKTLDGGSP